MIVQGPSIDPTPLDSPPLVANFQECHSHQKILQQILQQFSTPANTKMTRDKLTIILMGVAIFLTIAICTGFVVFDRARVRAAAAAEIDLSKRIIFNTAKRRIAAVNLSAAIGDRVNQAEFLQAVQDQGQHPNLQDLYIRSLRERKMAWIRMDASEFLDMSDRELLERFIQLDNQTELRNLKPNVLTDGKVTASMIATDIGHSINFLRVPLDNPNICTCCGNYLPLLYFEMGRRWCMKCLRAELIRRKTSSTIGAGGGTVRHAPEVIMMSDLDIRYRAQCSEVDPTCCSC
ncbi:hypothetical protein OCU04_007102 [Sclerotinia nivalis]|uniref:Uncharacterized protein n=1 Tax=Sclerotinia nivalis TaxID=352851 RepID=A0A9X0AL46_9HELO|nr:hypothetical protein OCU04_007102 [Sclerotinia nivalis]